jgi:hypothetical protein
MVRTTVPRYVKRDFVLMWRVETTKTDQHTVLTGLSHCT